MASSTDVGDQCPPPDATSPLPKTGQTNSHEDYDDGDLQRGTDWPSPRFTDNGDGTVRDNMTGLIWTKSADLLKEAVFWVDALAFCNGLSDATSKLTDGSESGDWVLPNVNELASLVDRGETDPALEGGTESPFLNVFSGGSDYWTSTSEPGDKFPWVVDFYYGKTSPTIADNARVWCVRDTKDQ
ncbi:MAG: DUF1566 domain-containing protein [Gammaproteobacteria bacterium]|nr:DUF1566 domain-containing protein [Gammaproteobacteria bacterium]